MRAADLLIQTLESLGNRYLFSLSGNQIMSIYDAWIDSTMELIHVRHEAAAVHMADAWGQLTGTPGVALVTAGPGFANTLSALYDAWAAESPVLLLSGNAALKDLGHAPFQEMNQVEMAKSVTKASWMVKDPAQIGEEVQKAMRLAMDGRTGPVHLCLPVDVLKAEIAQSPPLTPPNSRGGISNSPWGIPNSPSPSIGRGGWGVRASALAAQTLEAIRAAERPLLLAGPALMRSDGFRHGLSTFIERGLPLVGMENPRGLFEASLGAFSQVLAQADLLVLLGKKLDFMLKMGQAPFIHPDAHLIQIDHDAAVLELTERNAHNRQLLLLEQGDPEAVLTQLRAQVENNQNSPPISPQWANAVSQAISYRPPEWNKIQTLKGDPIHPAEVGRAIEQFLAGAEDSLLIADGGEFCQWIRACVHTSNRLSNGPAGCIGGVIPFALAARLARPQARIVVCTGDGGFGFHPFELDTAVRHNLPFIAIIGNDACWNAEYQVQLRDYGAQRIKGIHLLPTAYHQIARNLGGWGRYVDRADELYDALVAAYESGLPACLNVATKKEAAPKITIGSRSADG